jgi:hypothetical protein
LFYVRCYHFLRYDPLFYVRCYHFLRYDTMQSGSCLHISGSDIFSSSSKWMRRRHVSPLFGVGPKSSVVHI